MEVAVLETLFLQLVTIHVVPDPGDVTDGKGDVGICPENAFRSIGTVFVNKVLNVNGIKCFFVV